MEQGHRGSSRCWGTENGSQDCSTLLSFRHVPRRVSNSETTFVNQLSILFPKCGLRFLRCASEHCAKNPTTPPSKSREILGPKMALPSLRVEPRNFESPTSTVLFKTCHLPHLFKKPSRIWKRSSFWRCCPCHAQQRPPLPPPPKIHKPHIHTVRPAHESCGCVDCTTSQR